MCTLSDINAITEYFCLCFFSSQLYLLFLVALGLCCSEWAFSRCRQWGAALGADNGGFLEVQTVGAFSRCRQWRLSLGADSGGCSRCGQWGLLSRCGQWGLPLGADNGDCSLGAGLRFLIAAALLVEHRLQGMKALVVGAHGLSCSTVGGLFSNQGLNLCPFIDRWILYHLAIMVCVRFF